jgi:PHP family Zn ribbon phosphoesterase
MLKSFRADLHLHTCLSPCAEIEMTPREIVRVSLERGLDIIAVTDHNSAENAEATRRAAEGTGLDVLAGIEITSSEEVHVLALFESPDRARLMQEVIYDNLPPGENDERLYGQQVVVNESDEVEGFNKRLLISATRLPVGSILDVILSFGGISIASHVDRESFSVLSQLGFIPEDLRFDAVEISSRMSREKAETTFAGMRPFTRVSFSDAHCVKDIGKRSTTFTMKERTFQEMKQALARKDGRDVSWS